MAYPWMTLSQSLALEKEAARLGVSKVARSKRGFMRAYEAAGGSKVRMMLTRVPGHVQTWAKRRDGFIARHLKQYDAKPTYRRWLSLAMWAFRAPTRALGAASR